MMIEINDTLVNIDNVCSAKRFPNEKMLLVKFRDGLSEEIKFKNRDELEVGYQTLRLCETVIHKNRKS
ncbi:hypothetical protein [Mucilaginibacter xinganensis]|uniref:hypothetical protein n=1 Tax=Mucilaginibacter xinganensis TaxID=1234841 RepID=UPI000B99B329|nr:hypothetical protein [Mucilaginibacter xinganensis]